MSRRRSRDAALQALYALDIQAARGEAPPVEEVFQRVADHFELPEAARAFSVELCCGVASQRDALDARLAAWARNWRLSRMAAVDRNVLRLACYELLLTDAPPEVVLDEAVELARRYGSEASPAFVNGVLDAVARDIATERTAGAAHAPDPAGGGA